MLFLIGSLSVMLGSIVGGFASLELEMTLLGGERYFWATVRLIGFLLVLLGLGVCIKSVFSDSRPARVLEVGGCDSSGVCGVLYSDGSRGKESYPVKGQIKSKGEVKDVRHP